MCYRTLDNGETEFSTVRESQKCSNESGKDSTTVEDIGPQEEGESMWFVLLNVVHIHLNLINLLFIILFD